MSCELEKKTYDIRRISQAALYRDEGGLLLVDAVEVSGRNQP